MNVHLFKAVTLGELLQPPHKVDKITKDDQIAHHPMTKLCIIVQKNYPTLTLF